MKKSKTLKQISFVSIVIFLWITIYIKAKKTLNSLQQEMPDISTLDITYREKYKRIIDIIIAVPVTIIVIIPMVIIAIAIKIDSPGSVLFKQKRIGKNGKVFEMLKFRSMYMDSEHKGTGVYSKKGDNRVTRVGRILRATSLDELPQLFNILKGDMSFIGPRPPLTYHPWPIEDYTEEQLHMFDVRPGLSGWAQIHGRKNVEWNHRIELNNWYVSHVSFKLDALIFIITILKVLINADNENENETLDVKDNS